MLCKPGNNIINFHEVKLLKRRLKSNISPFKLYYLCHPSDTTLVEGKSTSRRFYPDYSTMKNRTICNCCESVGKVWRCELEKPWKHRFIGRSWKKKNADRNVKNVWDTDIAVGIHSLVKNLSLFCFCFNTLWGTNLKVKDYLIWWRSFQHSGL